MNPIPKVAVIAGGPSSEAAVSQRSAAGVRQALLDAKLEAEILTLNEELPFALRASGCGVAFPVTHGPLGEDGCLQGLLEVLGIPYVGSDVRSSALAAHKATAKVLFRAAGLPVADEVVIGRDDPVEQRLRDVRERLGARVVVKPVSGGSAIGVTRLLQDSTDDDFRAAVQSALEGGDGAVLVERFHSGFEVTCGVLELAEGPIALPPTLIHAQAADWYDFQSRYRSGGSRHECPAPLGEQPVRMVQTTAVAAHRALGARDLSRIDFVVEPNGEVILLEVNTLPGMTPTSNFPEAAQVQGIDFPELCRLLVERAVRRPGRLTPDAVPFPD